MDFVKYLEEELTQRVINAKLSRSVKLLLIQTIKHISLKYQETHVNKNEVVELIEKEQERANRIIKNIADYIEAKKELESLNKD